jgi:hypothetical protein
VPSASPPVPELELPPVAPPLPGKVPVPPVAVTFPPVPGFVLPPVPGGIPAPPVAPELPPVADTGSLLGRHAPPTTVRPTIKASRTGTEKWIGCIAILSAQTINSGNGPVADPSPKV